MRPIILTFLMIAPTTALAQSPKAQEREEVLKIFDLIMQKADVRSGDGLGSDVSCVFARKWDPSFHRDARGEQTDQFYPHEQLTIQQAIDPLERHADMFCNYAERDAQAQHLAQESNKTIAVASVGFSYPDFGPNLQTATVYYQRWSKLFLPNRKDLPVGSIGVITLRKQDGRWSLKWTSTGTMN